MVMINNVEGFDWDRANIGKCEKHGVSVAIIEQLFDSEIHVLGDVLHSDSEERFIAIGKLPDGRAVFVGFTFRVGKKGWLIRPITARYMHKKEIEKYEKAIAEARE